jgi:hypothetical protein
MRAREWRQRSTRGAVRPTLGSFAIRTNRLRRGIRRRACVRRWWIRQPLVPQRPPCTRGATRPSVLVACRYESLAAIHESAAGSAGARDAEMRAARGFFFGCVAAPGRRWGRHSWRDFPKTITSFLKGCCASGPTMASASSDIVGRWRAAMLPGAPRSVQVDDSNAPPHGALRTPEVPGTLLIMQSWASVGQLDQVPRCRL